MTEIPSDRFVQLSTGQPGLRATIHTEIREPSDSQPSTLNHQPVLDFISSDESLDRYNEVISAGGWQLHNYRRNPVFQNAHQTGDILHTIGRALITEIRSGGRTLSSLEPRSGDFGRALPNGSPSPGGEGRGEGELSLQTQHSRGAGGAYLFQRIEFACDVNPMARIAYGLYRGKFLSAVSVGFVPLRWENGTEKSAYSRKFVEQELLEVSAVAIPANPNALALGLKSGAIEKPDLKNVVDLFRSQMSSTPERSEVPIPNRDSHELSTTNDQLMRLFLDFHSLLKEC